MTAKAEKRDMIGQKERKKNTTRCTIAKKRENENDRQTGVL